MLSYQGWVKDLPKGEGMDHGERVEREPITGSEGTAPSRVQGQSPWCGSESEPMKLKPFRLFSYKKGPKVKYRKKRKRPIFGPWGGRPVRQFLDPPVATFLIKT